ncbi:hypothetical protein L7F22_033981 [Adiantum nelumboides]|nr:hypothetical protein [Adiantum nelumboides]
MGQPLFPRPELSWKFLAKGTYLDVHHSRETVVKLLEREPKFPMDLKEIKEAVQDWQKSRKGKGEYLVQEWEPLRRLRVSLIELETTAAASRSPKDFFENVNKADFFENTKNTLSIPLTASMAERGFIGGNTVLLDVSELLESLVRQSEPLLDQLGIKKDPVLSRDMRCSPRLNLSSAFDETQSCRMATLTLWDIYGHIMRLIDTIIEVVDELTPYLFLFVAEMMSDYIRAQQPELRGLFIPVVDEPDLVDEAYADDTMLFLLYTPVGREQYGTVQLYGSFHTTDENNPGFQEKICSTLRNWKYSDDNVSCISGSENDVVLLLKEADIAVNELDSRVASALDSTACKFQGLFWGGHPVPEGECHIGKRSITIATTASLPWMTGTAINPLLRAAYLAKDGDKNVTLLIPWLSNKDQYLVYPDQMTFNPPQEQEKYIKEWLYSRISFQPEFKIVFYPGKFSESKRSILAVDDITAFIPQTEADIAILEEPEHLTWYHHGARWTQKFRHVGIVHTNYLEYVKREKNGPFQALLLKYVNNWVINIYCHRVIRLSAATQTLPKSIVCNVHGVSPKFLQIGLAVAEENETGNKVFTHGIYFLGKMVWGKGYQELDLWALHKEELNELQLDVFGNGEDSGAVKKEAAMRGLRMKFHEGKDHADTVLQSYKVFINPSISDVVCTTTAEALAMGKIVVCAHHPSNYFFKDFPNCYMYCSSEDFVRKLLEGRTVKKTTRKHRYLQASVAKMIDAFDYGMFLAHYCLSGIEIARLASGAIPGTLHMDKEQQQDLGLV